MPRAAREIPGIEDALSVQHAVRRILSQPGGNINIAPSALPPARADAPRPGPRRSGDEGLKISSLSLAEGEGTGEGVMYPYEYENDYHAGSVMGGALLVLRRHWLGEGTFLEACVG
jgi:hypothetical protein